jgi:hypothetical protein
MHQLYEATLTCYSLRGWRIDWSAMQIPSSAYSEVRNSLEVLCNLVYLARHGVSDSAQVLVYLQMADEELSRLAESARMLEFNSTSH